MWLDFLVNNPPELSREPTTSHLIIMTGTPITQEITKYFDILLQKYLKYLEFAKRIELKSSYHKTHKEKNCNYVSWSHISLILSDHFIMNVYIKPSSYPLT